MPISSGYSIDAYCECDKCRGAGSTMLYTNPEMASAAGENYADCARELRNRGWYLSRDRRHALAPGHKKPEKWEAD